VTPTAALRRIGTGHRAGWLAVLAVAVLVASCGGTDGEDAALPEDADPMDRATAYLARELEQIETPDLAIFSYLHRNWSVEELAAAPERALELVGQPGGDATMPDRLTARLANPEQGPPPVEELEDYELPPEDSLVAALAPSFRALYCDAVPLGRSDVRLFRRAIRDGGYRATHAALGLVWSDELGCRWGQRDELGDATARVLRRELRQAAERGPEGVDDLSVQLASTLLYLGEDDAIPDGWVDSVLAAQNADGGWPSGAAGSEVSDWHTALHAFWMLLAVEDPGTGVPMVRAAEP
jgi:hypothetical protein